MNRIKFLQWAATQGWKHGQPILNKAYNYFFDKGKLPNPKDILQRAKKLYDAGESSFKGWTPKVIEGGKSKKIKKASGGIVDKALPKKSRDI